MKHHHDSEGLQVVNLVRGPVVALEFGELEVRRDWFLHDHLRERRVRTNILTVSSGSAAELFNLPVHLLESLIQEVLSIAGLEGLLVERRQKLSGG